MTKQQIKQRIEKLKKVINHHRFLYHVLDKQEISDAALDSLKHELYKLEQQYPEFVTADSPTQRVGGEPLRQFKKVEHKTPMLSIEDVFSEEELKDWEGYVRRLAPHHFFAKSGGGVEYFAELKIDGFAITLIYEKGVFVRGATRGNGKVGEDVTQNLKTIESIPLNLHIHQKLKPGLSHFGKSLQELVGKGTIEIRGEVYMTRKEFEKLNKELMKKGEKTYANPRNLAAGSIRQLDPKLAASRPLKFLAYDLVSDIGQKNHSQEHELLPFLGFKADVGKICKNIAQVAEYWQDIAKKRESLPFQIDGVVININDNTLFKKLGVAGKGPRGVRAFKFSPKQATTKILDIKVQVGRTGAITPIAVLEPVEVGGVIISRATLHNEGEIKRLGVKIGDTVIVERAGDVIPAVAKVLPDLRSGREKNFHFPNICPRCGTKLVKPEEEAIWRCVNRKCPARKRENLYHFASKKAFDIRGLGPKIIDKLSDAGLISGYTDIFKLKVGDIIQLREEKRDQKSSVEGFAEKSATKLIESIKKSKQVSLARFIYGLGIRHVGEETAVDLADYFGNINNLKKTSKEALEKIPNVGPEVAKSLYEWFRSQENQKLIDDLISVGVNILQASRIGKKFSEKTFVLTGGLATMTRDEAKQKIRLLGGNIAESVSKQTDYVVVGTEPGSKFEKAKKLGVKTVSEKEFLKMIG